MKLVSMSKILLTRAITVGVGSPATRTQAISRGSQQATLVWPRYKPKKDRYAVLDALSKTVEPISPPKIFDRGPGDPFLYRFSGKILLQYAQHWLTGRLAAEYVIDHNPHFFPGFRSNPKFVPDPEPLPGKEPTLENLRKLVKRRHAEQAHQMYTQLLSDHPDVIVPVGVKNSLLELLMFYGVGQPWVKLEKRSKPQETARNEEKPQETARNEEKPQETARNEEKPQETVNNFDTFYFTHSIKVWSKDSPGNLLFHEMKQQGIADTDTYTAYLYGLIMFKEFKLFSKYYIEMLDLNFQPPITIHNTFLNSIITNYKLNKIQPENVQDVILRVIEKMNSSPIVPPNQATFTKILLAKSFKIFPTDKLPPIHSVFHEMLSRGILPTLQQLSYVLSYDFLNLGYVTQYIKSHPEIVKFSPDNQLNFLILYAMKSAIRGNKPETVEFYRQLDRETSGLLDMSFERCSNVYMRYKIEQWDIGNREQADELCRLLVEAVNSCDKLGSSEISLIKRFADIGRYDLTMIIMQELFLLSESYHTSEKCIVLELFNWFVSDKLIKKEPYTSDIVKKAAEFMWSLIGQFERSKMVRSSEFLNLCMLAKDLYKELDKQKYKRISKWLEQKSRVKIKRNAPKGPIGIIDSELDDAYI